MQFSPIDVTKGIQNGLTRAQTRFGETAGPVSTVQLRNQITRALEEWPEEASVQFIELIAELTTTAAVARSWNEEPALRDDEIRAFMAHAFSFFNSFKHK